MAMRYCGDLGIEVTALDKGGLGKWFYRARVTGPEKGQRWSGELQMAPDVVRQRRFAIDSADAYDHIARSAVQFANHDIPCDWVCDGMELDAQGAVITRKPKTKV